MLTFGTGVEASVPVRAAETPGTPRQAEQYPHCDLLRVSLIDLTICPQRTAVVSLPAPALLEIDCTVYRTLKVEREPLFFFGLFDPRLLPIAAAVPGCRSDSLPCLDRS